MKTNKVLVVDDNKPFSQRLVNLLTEMETIRQVASAGTYKEAMEMLLLEQYDLVLLDIQLPDNNGIALLKQIKQRSLGGQVIMLSNLSNRYYRQECERLGAVYFIDKTTDIEKIQGEINRFSIRLAPVV